LTAIDHCLAVLACLVCVSQVFVRIDPARYRRVEFYQAGAATGIMFAFLPLLGWWASHRPIGLFGLHGWSAAGSLPWGAAWAALLAAIVLLVRYGVKRAWLAGIYRDYAWIMPRSRGELAASWATSIAAGAGEEIAFRGFLLWYAAGLVGAPAGLLLSSLLFGLMHPISAPAEWPGRARPGWCSAAPIWRAGASSSSSGCTRRGTWRASRWGGSCSRRALERGSGCRYSRPRRRPSWLTATI
jgi:membrane protease YdiL (CAAX protease family)